MSSTPRRIRATLLCGQLLALAAACGAPTDPLVGHRQEAIWNGLPAAQAGGVVYMEVALKQGATGYGSGVALNNNWVLTARHVLETAFRPSGIDFSAIKTHVGNPNGLGGTEYIAQTATIVVNGPWTAGSTVFALNYDMALVRFPYMGINGDPNYKMPIFHGVQGAGTITDQIVQGTWVECWGYGQGGPAGASGTLRHAGLIAETATFDAPVSGEGMVHVAPPALFLTKRVQKAPGEYWQIAEGDSGGPCYHIDAQSNYTVAGILRNRVQVGAEPDPVEHGLVTSVGAYQNITPGNLDKELQRILDTNPAYAQFGDVDGDSFPDLAMLSTDNGYIHAALQLTSIGDAPPFVQGGLADLGSVGFPPIAESYVDSAVAAIGDFDHNGAGDILMFVGGTPVYFDGQVGAIPVLHADISPSCLLPPFDCKLFQPATTSYTELRAADLNGDEFTDVEALVEPNSAPDVYYGSEHGLTSAVEMSGFPTSDGNDGKLLTLAVHPANSIGEPDYYFEIQTQPSSADEPLRVEIFDADMGVDERGANSANVKTCYQLLSNGVTHEVLLTKTDADFPDGNNAWRSLTPAGQVNDPKAAIGNGSFDYLLNVYLTTTSCDENAVYPDDDVSNVLKLRTNGQLWFGSSYAPITGGVGAVSFQGSDAAGDFAAATSCATPPCPGVLDDVDTTYDGTFSFAIATTLTTVDQQVIGQNDIWIADADADSTAVGEISPGKAVGRSADTAFVVQNFPGLEPPPPPFMSLSYFHPAHPSGQFNASIQRCVSYKVSSSPTPFGEDLYWVWSKVLTHNNIWVSVPVISAQGIDSLGCNPYPDDGLSSSVSPQANGDLLAPLRLYGEKPRVIFPTTSATPLATWVTDDADTQIKPLLPITLGEDGSGHGAQVHSADQAQNILRRGANGPHGVFAMLVDVLKAELLTAKLNLARGATHGEAIDHAYLYGATDRVSDVIDRADHALANACNGLHCTSHADMMAITAQLRSINASNTTYTPPVPAHRLVLGLAKNHGSMQATPISHYWSQN